MPGVEEPRALDVSDDGRVAVLDRGGRRLTIGERAIALDRPARRCRFHGASVLLLLDGALRTLDADGGDVHEAPLRSGAVDLAVMKSGSVLVGYPDVVERLGARPLTHPVAARVLAPDAGGCWAVGAEAAAYLRPRPEGLVERTRVALRAPAHAAAVGPDGALWVADAEGVRSIEAPDAVHVARVVALARSGRRLLGLGDDGVVDLTAIVPPPSGPSPQPDLPACGT